MINEPSLPMASAAARTGLPLLFPTGIFLGGSFIKIRLGSNTINGMIRLIG
ncbi:hypothetical protein D3C81_2288510 [compost metagenome]